MNDRIRFRNQQFNDYVNTKDAVSLSQLYTQDAVLYPPKQPMVRSREAIACYFDAIFKMGIAKGNFNTGELTVTGTHAFETGNYQLYTSENLQAATGFYAYLWACIEGEWYIVSDIWND